MNNESILNQIMADNLEKGMSDLSLVEAVKRLFEVLNKREQEVLRSRFGLGGSPKETLEAIGQKHQLTRERIRQIETSSIAKLKKSSVQEEVLAKIKALLSQLMVEHAGFADKHYLYGILHALKITDGLEREEHDRYADFLVTKLLNEHFDEVKSGYFNKAIKLKFVQLDHLEAMAEEVLNKIKDKKKLLVTEELINLVKASEGYKNNQDKFQIDSNLELHPVLSKLIPDFTDNIYEHRPLYSFLQALVDLEQNRYQQWGHRQWREVTPKTINDKIYLVLKNHGKPMYYGDIAKNIADMGFDQKNVNVATTHNELILDDKYVLVGRGLYGLKEWGYQDGTVADVIAAILEKSSGALSREDIIKKVMDQRMVKETTVNLALMNKLKFRKATNGHYELEK